MLYKSKILTLVTIGYSCCMMMSIVIGPKWPFYSCCKLYWTSWDRFHAGVVFG